MPARSTRQPSRSQAAFRYRVFPSRIWPRPGVSAAGTSSSPVVRMETRGRRNTGTGSHPIEARTDSYPDQAEIGRLAAALGAGSPEAYQA